MSFGLVNVPVKAYNASRSKNITFNLLHEKDHSRIRRKRVCGKEGEEVPSEEIVRGYEISPDRYVILSDEEIEAADPESAKTIELEDFVPLSDIDPAFFDKPYWLVPDKAAGKAYALLHKAMRESGKVAIGRVVMRTKEHLVALRTSGDALMMVTIRHGDEVIPAEVALEDAGFTTTEPSEKEVKMAEKLVEALTTDFDPERYKDRHREALMKIIEQKLEGQEVVVRREAEERPATEDILSALEESVKRAEKEIEAT